MTAPEPAAEAVATSAVALSTTEEERAAPSDPNAPGVFDAALYAPVVEQIVFYMSDANLPTDRFLLKHVRRDPEGFVPLTLLASFPKTKALLKDLDPTPLAACLRDAAPSLVVSLDGMRARRKSPLAKVDMAEIIARTLLVEDLPGAEAELKLTVDLLKGVFGRYGRINMARIHQPTANKQHYFQSRAMPIQQYALIEYDSEDAARRAALEFPANPDKDPGFETIKVSLLQLRPQRRSKSMSVQGAAGPAGVGLSIGSAKKGSVRRLQQSASSDARNRSISSSGQGMVSGENRSVSERGARPSRFETRSRSERGSYRRVSPENRSTSRRTSPDNRSTSRRTSPDNRSTSRRMSPENRSTSRRMSPENRSTSRRMSPENRSTSVRISSEGSSTPERSQYYNRSKSERHERSPSPEDGGELTSSSGRVRRQSSASTLPPVMEDEGPREVGVIESVLKNGAFGFIKTKTSRKNVFFHSSEVDAATRQDLQAGDVVEFSVAYNPKTDKDNAVHVVRIEKKPKDAGGASHKHGINTSTSVRTPVHDDESSAADKRDRSISTPTPTRIRSGDSWLGGKLTQARKDGSALFITAKGPDGTRGFGKGRGKPLA